MIKTLGLYMLKNVVMVAMPASSICAVMELSHFAPIFY